MFELDASISRGEAPLDGALGAVALCFPRSYFLGETLLIGNTPIQALSSEHGKLYLSHV